MPDIFDQLDIFDEIAPDKGDIFDQILPERPIGLVEAAIERPLEKIPFSPVGALRTLKIVESGKRLGSFDYTLTEEDVIRKYPNVHPAHIKRIAKNADELYRKDVDLVTAHLDDLAEQERRGYSLMGQVGRITSEMPAFMIEFLMTGGLQKVGTATARRYGTRLLGKYATTTAGKAALATGGFAIGTAARSAGMPHRAADAILRRQTPRDIKITDAGAEIIGPVEEPMTSVWKGLTDHYIEIASEQAGEFIAPIAGKLFIKLPLMGKFTGMIQKRWLQLHPDKKIVDFMKKISTKVGYHGVVGEIGEEYLGDIARAITDVEHFGAGEDAGMLERIGAAVKQDTQMLPAMAISFAIPGMMRAAPAIIMPHILSGDAQENIQIDKTLTSEQKEIQQRIIGNIRTQIVTETISKFPENVTDQASLEKVGNAIAKELGIEKKITWKWSTRPVTWQKGAHQAGKITINSKHLLFNPRLAYAQVDIKKTIIHEIGHIAKPPVRKEKRYRIHHQEFKDWLDENRKILEPIEVERYVPIAEVERRTEFDLQWGTGRVKTPNSAPATEEFFDWYNRVGKEKANKKGYYLNKNWYGEWYVKKSKKAKPIFITEPAPIEPTLEAALPDEGKPYETQYAAGHDIPKILGLKEKERRALMKKTTGVSSMKKMSPRSAQRYIDELHQLAQEKGIEAVPFTARRFKRPISPLTPQLYKATILGVDFMINPAVLGKQKLDIEFHKISTQVNKMEKIINKLGGETAATKLKAKIRGKPTKSIKRFADLLNTHEESPIELTEQEKEVFNFFRTLSRTIWTRENEVRERLDMELIPYRTGYMRHIIDTLAQDIIDGRHPIPEDLKYWAEQKVRAKIRNPMEFQRRLGQELDEIFSNDLIRATKSMLWTGLKEIHLNEPLKHFKNQLGLHSEVIPSSTRRWTERFVNTMIKGQQTWTDQALNRIVLDSGIGKLINRIGRPFGRTVSNRPLTKLFQKAGRLQIYGVMGWRPKQLIRNKFQLLQNLALYNVKANLKSFLPGDAQLKGLLSESLFLEGYKGFEDLREIDKRTLGRLWLAPFQWTAVSNARQAMKAGYYDMLDLIENPEYKGLRGWADSKRTYVEEPGFLYPSEKRALEEEMPFGASATQYHYIPMAMPEIFRHKAAIPFTRLQSWWMNHFFKFHREAAYRFFKGETHLGRELPWSRRIGWFRYLLIGGIILNTLGYTKSYLLGVMPSGIPPIGQVLIYLYMYLTVSSERARASALRRLLNAIKTFIPGYLAYKDIKGIWEGKTNLNRLFFYAKGIFAEEKDEREIKRF